MQTRGIPAAVIVFGCATILLLNAIVSRGQLRAGADRRGISIGAAVNIAPFRNEPIYTQTLSREFNMLVGEKRSSSTLLSPLTTALILPIPMPWSVSRWPTT